MTDGYMVYVPPFKVRFWRALGFHSPAAPMLTQDQLKQGWDEQVFAHTTITLSLLDRLRILISGRAKLFTIVSTKQVTVPEALTNVGFGVLYPGQKD